MWFEKLFKWNNLSRELDFHLQGHEIPEFVSSVLNHGAKRHMTKWRYVVSWKINYFNKNEMLENEAPS